MMSCSWFCAGAFGVLLTFGVLPGCGSKPSPVSSNDDGASGSNADLGGGVSAAGRVPESTSGHVGGTGPTGDDSAVAGSASLADAGAPNDERAEVGGSRGSSGPGSTSAGGASAGAANHAGAGGASAAGTGGVANHAGAGGASAAGTGGVANHAGASGASALAGSGGMATHGAGGSAGAVQSQMVPCEPYAVIANVCQHCHSDPALNDAPFALVSYQQIKFQAAAIEGAVESGQMPKSPYSLSSAEQATLLAWIEAGANAVPLASCP